MHEKERHRCILAAVQDKPVVTVQEMVELTESSEATIRRDIAALHMQKKLRRVRGGAEAISPPQFVGLAGRPFSLNETAHIAQKKAIAREAVALCADGDSIIVNGGTTTFQMVYPLSARRMQVLTNSFPIAEHLLKHSKNTILLPGGTIYREQMIVLSPFENDVTRNFYARRMFMGAQGLGALGLMEADPAADPGRAEADQPGGRARRAGRLLEVRAALEPDPLRPRPDRDGHHRRPRRRPRRGDARRPPGCG